MKYDPEIHQRHSIRLPGFDYARAGAYYLTIVSHGREELFGTVVDGEMKLNQTGQMVDQAWHGLPTHYPHVELDAFCIMPNHVHGIIILKDDFNDVEGAGHVGVVGAGHAGPVGAGLRPAPTRGTHTRTRHPLSEIVCAFKSFSARRINALRGLPGIPVWQRNYYEHIIRDNQDYLAKSNYILDNPRNWMKDNENPQR